MGGYTVKDGCLLEGFKSGEVQHIAHIVNSKGIMGSGIAKIIRDEYPEVYKVYHTHCAPMFHEKSEDLLGTTLGVNTGGSIRVVYNLFAQDNFGRDKRHLDYGALGQCLVNLKKYLARRRESGGETSLGIPYKMGCDSAGGDWDVVEEMIKFMLKDFDVIVYKL